MVRNNFLCRWRGVLEAPTFYIVAVIVLIVTAIGWSSIFQIDKVVRVEGKIIPTGHSRPIQHLEGGIISSIAVHEGAQVKEGDLLLTIDATAAGASLNETNVKLITQRVRAVRLKAEASLLDSLIFPDSLAAEASISAERSLFLTRKSKLSSDLHVHEQTISQHTVALTEIDMKQKDLMAELAVAQTRRGMLEKMAARQAASQIELLESQSRERRLETELREAENTKPKIRAALATEQARRAAVLAEFKSTAQTELVVTLAEIDRLNQTVAAAQDRMKRTDIRAPIDGTINRISVATIGAVVKSGEALIELTPVSSEVFVEARVLPQDRGELRSDIIAKVRVSAYDFAMLGALEGRLTEISADTMQDAKGEAYYRAKILIEGMPASYAGRPIMPGMTVTGDLVTGRRTILSYLLSPLFKFTQTTLRDSR